MDQTKKPDRVPLPESAGWFDRGAVQQTIPEPTKFNASGQHVGKLTCSPFGITRVLLTRCYSWVLANRGVTPSGVTETFRRLDDDQARRWFLACGLDLPPMLVPGGVDPRDPIFTNVAQPEEVAA